MANRSPLEAATATKTGDAPTASATSNADPTQPSTPTDGHDTTTEGEEEDDGPEPFAEGPVIYTPRLLLRPLTMHDAPFLHDMFSHESVRRFTSRHDGSTLTATRAWLRPRLCAPACRFAVHELTTPSKSIDANADSDALAAARAAAGPFVGTVGVAGGGPPDIGYGFVPAFGGRGYATEAVRGLAAAYWALVPPVSRTAGSVKTEATVVLARPFSREAESLRAGPALDRIQASVFAGNAASARVLEKAGFVRVGSRANVVDGLEAGAAAEAGREREARFACARPGVAFAECGYVVDGWEGE